MSPESAFYALCALGVAVLFYGPWQGLAAELARQVIYRSRDRLFDLAASGEWSFDDPVYRETRALLNGLARFCHKMTVPRMVMAIVLHRMACHQGERAFPFEKLSGNSRLTRTVRREFVRAILAAVLQAIARSALGLLVLPLLLVAARVVSVRRQMEYSAHFRSAAVHILEEAEPEWRPQMAA